MLGVALTDARFRIADLSDPHAILNGKFEAIGATRQFVRFAAQTLARGRHGGLDDSIPVSGNGKLEMQFDLPLQQPEPIKFTGNYEFIDNQLDPGPRLPSLAKINGGIAFTESGLKVDRSNGAIAWRTCRYQFRQFGRYSGRKRAPLSRWENWRLIICIRIHATG